MTTFGRSSRMNFVSNKREQPFRRKSRSGGRADVQIRPRATHLAAVDRYRAGLQPRNGDGHPVIEGNRTQYQPGEGPTTFRVESDARHKQEPIAIGSVDARKVGKIEPAGLAGTETEMSVL
jgi:hypothetical protein